MNSIPAGWPSPPLVLALALTSLMAACGDKPESAVAAPPPPMYDLVLAGGRVMDPESGLDAIRNVGIRNGRIRAIRVAALEGREVVDVSGLVVAPGFIDLHAHGQHEAGEALQVRDGVTTALDMESGVYPVQAFIAERRGTSLINFGASVSHGCLRILVKNELSCDGHFLTNPDKAREIAQLDKRAQYEPASEAELERMLATLADELRAGGLGVGFGLEYVPGAGRAEVYQFFKTAAEFQAPVFVHVRRRPVDPAPGIAITVAQEVIANAAITGAPTQLVHVTSTGLQDAPVIIEMIEKAQGRGIDISTEAYPYTAGSTSIGSALFDEGWRARWGNVDYDILQWTQTGERLTADSFRRYREEQPTGKVVIHVIPEEIASYAVAHPIVSIASDGMPWLTPKEHPRGAGSFARVLGHYVRERGLLDLMLGLRKMTLMPAQRMEKFAPALRNKGRIQIGADADITVFDPELIIDRATFTDSMQPSAGIPHVLVGGTFVVRDGELLEGVYPGQPMVSGLAAR